MTHPLTLISHKAPPSGESLPRGECPEFCPACLCEGVKQRLDYVATDYRENFVHGLGAIVVGLDPAHFHCGRCDWWVEIQENDDGE